MNQPRKKLAAKFATLLHDVRTSQGLTLDDIAAATGLHRTAVGLIERGERVPSLANAFELANALSCSLSELILQIEGTNSKSNAASASLYRGEFLTEKFFRNDGPLSENCCLSPKKLKAALSLTYKNLYFIDQQLIANGSEQLSKTVELANLSSVIGNILGASIAKSSDGYFERNRPHTFPDLLPLKKPAKPLEIKVALETNKPKGHLPKAGMYITFRYILGLAEGKYIKGKENRGGTPWIWEIKVGHIREADFSLSNTAGDSGKTAIIKTDTFNNMALVYFVPEFLPYSQGKSKPYPGYN